MGGVAGVGGAWAWVTPAAVNNTQERRSACFICMREKRPAGADVPRRVANFAEKTSAFPVTDQREMPHRRHRAALRDRSNRVEELTDALISAGWYFPRQREDARTAARDLLLTIELARTGDE